MKLTIKNSSSINLPLLPENVTTDNKDYAEALMNMSDKGYGVPGEYWISINDSDQFTPGKLYRASNPVNEKGAFIDNNGIVNGYAHNPLDNMRKATFKEIQAHFEQLPEHWAFEVTKENYKEFKHLRELPDNANISGYITSLKYNNLGWGIWTHNLPPKYTLIPFELFKKHYLMQEKKITGYKLIKEEYIDAVGQIVNGDTMSVTFKKEKIISSPSKAKKILEKAGVLDLWFEPVYEQQEQRVDMGEWEIKVKDNKAYYGSEDITWYVERLIWRFEPQSLEKSEGKTRVLDINVNTLTFTQTGCVMKPSKYSDWLKVYNLINI